MQYCSAISKKAVNLGQWVAAASAGQLWSQTLNISDLFSPGKECIRATVDNADAEHVAGSHRNPCKLRLSFHSAKQYSASLSCQLHESIGFVGSVAWPDDLV